MQYCINSKMHTFYTSISVKLECVLQFIVLHLRNYGISSFSYVTWLIIFDERPPETHLELTKLCLLLISGSKKAPRSKMVLKMTYRIGVCVSRVGGGYKSGCLFLIGRCQELWVILCLGILLNLL